MNNVKVQTTREGANYSDVLPPKAARRDSISNSNIFWGLQIWAADEPNAVSFTVAVGRHDDAD